MGFFFFCWGLFFCLHRHYYYSRNFLLRIFILLSSPMMDFFFSLKMGLVLGGHGVLLLHFVVLFYFSLEKGNLGTGCMGDI